MKTTATPLFMKLGQAVERIQLKNIQGGSATIIRCPKCKKECAHDCNCIKNCGCGYSCD
ncbi:MAG: hypothetical protein QM528_08210 [Phycisphaerales bacterium]|nr:hypothetical protein [Phycisphaerales bacterium]